MLLLCFVCAGDGVSEFDGGDDGKQARPHIAVCRDRKVHA